MMLKLLGLAAVVASGITLSAATREPAQKVPLAGFVPDSITAVRIAEAVWIPIYGQKQVRRERPFGAHLLDGVWTVEGSLPRPSNPKFDVVGGVMHAEIAKQDGRILKVFHSK